ncbi:MAG TPA: hypothetical protein ENI87_14575 [bacterium]|nr:hypothetical protein [bacterium]
MKSHLQVAPDYLQEAASRMFELQARQIEQLLANGDVESLSAALTEIQNKYAARLRHLAAGETAARRGLLVVDGHDIQERIRGKIHVRYNGGESILGRTVEVLVVLDDGDRELEELDRQYRELRAIHLVDALQHFNNLPYEERLRITDEFRKRLAAGTERDGGRKWFGIEPHELQWVRIEPSTRQVVPIEL